MRRRITHSSDLRQTRPYHNPQSLTVLFWLRSRNVFRSTKILYTSLHELTTMMHDLQCNITVRNVAPSDAATWEAMRTELWPDGATDHATEIAMFFAGTLTEPVAVLVAQNLAGVIVGFVELSIRVNVADLASKRVGYVEGLYVSPNFRHNGIGRKLLQASRIWTRRQKCTAFASDRADRLVIDWTF